MPIPTPAPAEKHVGAALRHVAYYHEPYWQPGSGDWIRSLLLFFGVALLVPRYMR
jgi:hypothetical protein